MTDSAVVVAVGVGRALETDSFGVSGATVQPESSNAADTAIDQIPQDFFITSG